MINTLPKSLIEAAQKILEESNTPRLKHIADVKTNFPDADYYLIRKGSPDTVGKVTTDFSPEHIGVKITHEGVLPKYHQYAMQYAHMNGYWKQKGKGVLALQHISVDDVKNMPAIYQGLNESVVDTHIDVDGELKHIYNSDGNTIHHTDEGIKNFHRWFKDSKAVDEHGRPLVVYHGTNAHVYSGDKEIDNFHTNPESGRGAAFFTSNKSLANEYGEKVYNTYLKLKNPLIIDAQGKHWTSISHNSPIKGEATEQLNVARKQKYDDFESVAKDMEELLGEPYTPREFKPSKSLEGHSLKHIPGLEHDDIETDQIVKAARKNGFDGVVFHNVKDSPTNDKGYKHAPSDVYAVFHSRHIKSTENNGQFGTEWHHGIKE